MDSSAVVTGGSQGLGLAIAQRSIDERCNRLVIAARDPVKGAEAAQQLGASGAEVGFITVDMGDAKSVLSMIDAAAGRMGRISALVNTAALTDRGSILNTSPEEWDRMMAANARGPFFAIQRVAQTVINAWHPARVVNYLTMSPHGGQSFLAAYSASKAALANITRNAAKALRTSNIRVTGKNAAGWIRPARMRFRTNGTGPAMTGWKRPGRRSPLVGWSSPIMWRVWPATCWVAIRGHDRIAD